MRVFGYPIGFVQVSRTNSKVPSHVFPAYLALDRGQGIRRVLKEGTRSDQLYLLGKHLWFTITPGKLVQCATHWRFYCAQSTKALAKFTGSIDCAWHLRTSNPV